MFEHEMSRPIVLFYRTKSGDIGVVEWGENLGFAREALRITPATPDRAPGARATP